MAWLSQAGGILVLVSLGTGKSVPFVVEHGVGGEELMLTVEQQVDGEEVTLVGGI